MQEKSRAASVASPRRSSIRYALKSSCTRNTSFSGSNIVWHRGIDSYRALASSFLLLRHKREIVVVGLVFSYRLWNSCSPGHDLRQVCISAQSAETYRAKAAPYPPQNGGETLPKRIGSVQLLAQEVLRSDSSLLRRILGYISAARSPGLKANGVDRGLYPPST